MQEGTGHPEAEYCPPHVLSRGGYDYFEQKLLAEKTKKKLDEAAQSRSVDGVIALPFKLFFILNMMLLYFILPISNIIV